MSDTQANFYVYFHTRLNCSEPFYIGKGRGQRAYSRRGRNRYWNRIVAKDGGFHAAFLKKDVDEDFAMLIEIEAIDVLRRRGVKLVNVTDGGDGTSGLAHTLETRAKISATNKGMPAWNKGVPHTQEAKNKMSVIRKGRVAINKGKPHSEETKNKMSLTRKGRLALNKGIPASDSTKQKISEANKGQIAWNKGIKNSPETRHKISMALIGNTHLRGKKLSEETKLKMSLAAKKRFSTNG